MDLHYEAINIVSQSKEIAPVGGRQFTKVSSVLSEQVLMIASHRLLFIPQY